MLLDRERVASLFNVGIPIFFGDAQIVSGSVVQIV